MRLYSFRHGTTAGRPIVHCIAPGRDFHAKMKPFYVNIYYNEGHAFHRTFLFQLIFHTVIFIHLLFVINFSVTSRSHANQWAKLFQYFRLDRFPTKKEKKKKNVSGVWVRV